jgi:hypothetical protein
MSHECSRTVVDGNKGDFMAGGLKIEEVMEEVEILCIPYEEAELTA